MSELMKNLIELDSQVSALELVNIKFSALTSEIENLKTEFEAAIEKPEEILVHKERLMLKITMIEALSTYVKRDMDLSTNALASVSEKVFKEARELTD